MKVVYIITHPDVVIDPDVPIPRWPLSERGVERMRVLLAQPWISDITAIYCSTEQKAIDGADILAKHLSLPVHRVAELGENDRSATGFLPHDAFQATVDQFFAHPNTSIRGWETAAAAEQRMVRAVNDVIDRELSSGAIAIVSHGGVGTLLRCHLAQDTIARAYDQPGSSGGNYYAFESASRTLIHEWKAIDIIE